jgi:hypothetical protein
MMMILIQQVCVCSQSVIFFSYQLVRVNRDRAGVVVVDPQELQGFAPGIDSGYCRKQSQNSP